MNKLFTYILVSCAFACTPTKEKMEIIERKGKAVVIAPCDICDTNDQTYYTHKQIVPGIPNSEEVNFGNKFIACQGIRTIAIINSNGFLTESLSCLWTDSLRKTVALWHDDIIKGKHRTVIVHNSDAIK